MDDPTTVTMPIPNRNHILVAGNYYDIPKTLKAVVRWMRNHGRSELEIDFVVSEIEYTRWVCDPSPDYLMRDPHSSRIMRAYIWWQVWGKKSEVLDLTTEHFGPRPARQATVPELFRWGNQEFPEFRREVVTIPEEEEAIVDEDDRKMPARPAKRTRSGKEY